MALINYGKVDKKFLIPILGAIFRMICKYLLSINPKYEIATKNHFILSIYMSIGMILAFIPFLIIKSRTKEKTKEMIQVDSNPSQSILSIKYVHGENELKVRKKRKYKYIFISELLDFSSTLLMYQII